jgi:hypothetical protein
VILHALRHVEQLQLRRQCAVPAQPVDRPVARGRQEPGPRVVGPALARPALGGDRERLLGGLLGDVEVAEEADQVGEDAPPLVAEDVGKDG